LGLDFDFTAFRHHLNPKVAVLRIKQKLLDDVEMWYEGYILADGRDCIANAIMEFRSSKGYVVVNLINNRAHIKRKRPAGDIDRLAIMSKDFLIQLLSLAPLLGRYAVYVAQKVVCPKYAERNKCFHLIRRHFRRNSWAPESIELLLQCLSRKKSLDVATEKDRTVKTAMQTVGTS